MVGTFFLRCRGALVLTRCSHQVKAGGGTASTGAGYRSFDMADKPTRRCDNARYNYRSLFANHLSRLRPSVPLSPAFGFLYLGLNNLG
jgi:hypothetical protein